jgi:hypothetical protein
MFGPYHGYGQLTPKRHIGVGTAAQGQLTSIETVRDSSHLIRTWAIEWK